MNRIPGLLILSLAVLLTMSCAQPETETAEEMPAESPSAETGPDPAVVDPDHYTVEFENDRVRVLRIAYGPGEASVMHYHPEAVAVFLNDVQGQFELPDGSIVETHPGAGEHEFTPAGLHLPSNTGEESFELVLVELKDAATPAAGETGADPVVVDADHYKVEFENDRVRVLRITYEAGEKSVMHYHPDNVAVFLSENHGQFEMPDGSTSELHPEPGEHVYAPAGLHLPSNIGEAPFELVLVELK